MGLIYTEGVYSQQGNQAIYGSLIAGGGFGSGGTPQVWYDARLKNEMDLSVPEIVVVPSGFGYGVWPVNSMHNPTKTVTVINYGDAPLSFIGDGAVISRSASREFHLLAPNTDPIPPQSARQFYIGFNPIEEGRRGGTLTIYTDDPDEGTVVIPFSGGGGERFSQAGLQNIEIVENWSAPTTWRSMSMMTASRTPLT